MPLPSRVAEEDVEPGKEFELDAVYVVELQNLMAWLNTEANNRLGPVDAKISHVQSAASMLQDSIKAQYCADPIARDPALLGVAARGELKKHLPSRSTMATLRGLFWTSALVEFAIGLATYVFGDGSSFAPIAALLLAAGGWALGFGVGLLAKGYHVLPRSIEPNSVKQFGFLGLIGAIIGFALIAAIAYLRSGAVSNPAIMAFTVALALLVAFAEGGKLLLSERKKRLRELMFNCQRWYATEQHSLRCKEGFYGQLFSKQAETIGIELKRAVA